MNTPQEQTWKVHCQMANVPYSKELQTRSLIRLKQLCSEGTVHTHQLWDLVKEIHDRMEHAWKPE